jgi:hypothetical protein
MQRMLLLIIMVFTLTACVGQSDHQEDVIIPRTTTIRYKIGSQTILLSIYKYGNNADPVYINMHDDEKTSLVAAQKLLGRKGGMLIKIENNSKRNIAFKFEGHTYTFDPNRMFSRVGIHQTLMNHGRSNEKVITEIEKFGKRFLQLIPENASCIVALHNNTDGKFSVESYLSGNDRAKDAKAIHINPGHDPDDFFLTTDSILFRKLARENFNSVLQNNSTARKDGSLSIWCGERNINYLNCETQHGRLSQYNEMIAAAARNIESASFSRNTVTFKIPKIEDEIVIEDGAPLWFGEKTVGLVKSKTKADSGIMTGILELNRNFPVYSNMDFYLLGFSSGSYRFEVRIDPTRKKSLLTSPLVQIKYRRMP